MWWRETMWSAAYDGLFAGFWFIHEILFENVFFLKKIAAEKKWKSASYLSRALHEDHNGLHENEIEHNAAEINMHVYVCKCGGTAAAALFFLFRFHFGENWSLPFMDALLLPLFVFFLSSIEYFAFFELVRVVDVSFRNVFHMLFSSFTSNKQPIQFILYSILFDQFFVVHNNFFLSLHIHHRYSMVISQKLNIKSGLNESKLFLS